MNIEKQLIDQRVKKIIEDNPELFQQDEGRNISRAFLYLSVASYFDTDIADIVSYITEGGDDGGFDAAYMHLDENTIHVTMFQSKYVRDLEKDAEFPANAIEKAVFTVKTVFDPKSLAQLNKNSRKIVEQIRSYIDDGYIPYVTFVMVNNGRIWNKDGENKINNEFSDSSKVEFVHFNHSNILNALNRGKDINAQIRFSGKAVGERLVYKSVVIGRVCVTESVVYCAPHIHHSLFPLPMPF